MKTKVRGSKVIFKASEKDPLWVCDRCTTEHLANGSRVVRRCDTCLETSEAYYKKLEAQAWVQG